MFVLPESDNPEASVGDPGQPRPLVGEPQETSTETEPLPPELDRPAPAFRIGITGTAVIAGLDIDTDHGRPQADSACSSGDQRDHMPTIRHSTCSFWMWYFRSLTGVSLVPVKDGWNSGSDGERWPATTSAVGQSSQLVFSTRLPKKDALGKIIADIING